MGAYLYALPTQTYFPRPDGPVPRDGFRSGGIVEPVEVFWTPATRIEDVFVRPDWKTGELRIRVTAMNTTATARPGQFQFAVTAASANEPLARLNLDHDLQSGTNEIECRLKVAQHRWWQLDDPFL